MSIKFIVYGRPQGKARPRFTKTGRVYTPKTTRDYEKKVCEAYKAAGGVYFKSHPVEVCIQVYFSNSRIKKPDIDNIAKIILDGLNNIAYDDDKQVVKLSVEKKITLECPRVEVEILQSCN